MQAVEQTFYQVIIHEHLFCVKGLVPVNQRFNIRYVAGVPQGCLPGNDSSEEGSG